ncbi:phosphonate C-P lyase system protein PhnH [Cetobacterium sp.]|uniref:phosphonate C-P lyase system protein PhnH n=1 Tax=Cetobacterium sp. TaxID=2071632 RepID=UPI003EE65C9F
MKIEKFDFVHDIQKIYRKLLDSMSKPGTINNIENEIQNLEVYSSLSKEMMALAYTLLNIESKFYIENEEEKKYVKLHTFAQEKVLEKAEFILVDSKKDGEEKILEVIENASIGTLEDPHLGATLIISVDKITNKENLILKGPGIKNQTSFSIDGLSEKIFEKRDLINSEFPLGIDFILVDKFGNIGCLPRTTKLEVKR